MIRVILLLLYLTKMSIVDIKELVIKTYDIFFLLGIILLFNYKLVIGDFVLPIIIFVLFCIYMQIKESIGGGDIKVIVVLSLYYQFEIFNILFYASFLGILYNFSVNGYKFDRCKLRNNKIPFIPFLEGGIICQILMNYLVT